jgi:hypothetical protein
MWEPRRLTTLWAFTGCYRDSFLLRAYTSMYVLVCTRISRAYLAASGTAVDVGESCCSKLHSYVHAGREMAPRGEIEAPDQWKSQGGITNTYYKGAYYNVGP